MARIRSVKPEFWSDPDLVGLPMAARLFFIGTWNHADDYGVLKDDPGRLKLQILPNDDVDAAALIDYLVDSGHLLRRVAKDGTPVLVVRTFIDHQKIDKRATGRWGHPDEFADPPHVPPVRDTSPLIPTDPSDSPPRTGTERTGTEKVQTVVEQQQSTALAVVGAPASPPATSPVGQVFAAWVESTGHHRAVCSPERIRLIQKQLRLYPVEDLIDAVRGWRHSAHHRGENDRNTVYDDLELLLRDAKHIEQFRDLERDPPPAPVPKSAKGIAEWLNRRTG